MQQNDSILSISPAACIVLALSTVLLPLHWVAAWLFAMLFHEAGHLLAVRICRSKLYKIRFKLCGAVIAAEPMSNSRQLCCTLAGPVSGLLLVFARKWFPILAICGCLQSLFNLLPLLNLDGGRVLHCILLFFLDEQQACVICTVIDKTLRICLLVLSLIIAWKMAWFALAVFCTFTLLCRWKQKFLANAPVRSYNSSM